MKEAVKLKKARRAVASVVTKAKTQVREEIEEVMGKNFQLASTRVAPCL